MAVGITHILTVLSIVQYTLKVGDQTDAATQDLLRQHEERQSREMTRLLEEMEQRSQEARGLAQQGVLLAVCRHWWVAASVETLLVLFGLYWLPRRRSADSDSGGQQGSSSSAVEKSKGEEHEWQGKAGCNDMPDQVTSWEKRPKWLVQDMPGMMATFSVAAGSTYEGLSAHEDNTIDRLLLVPLRPPIGHFFHQSGAP
ncbi:hypothetical protein QYF61_013249 [Mycteria americana]|uniref:Uncharacterized protein n=1 Tax=Mycteria americana TaxID=33587 RepID=A0AAN7NUK6_MYCAM|nr:hypothetical protein QYF61_013242 [Mycteria americana]KAK4830754.1 hypothetical protein QYF61_013243 [Mycteria americana]KAK4830755.1 hypothetical protein QYF61_013244 [Mycteria americana]KAK4830756.1 hypothetical protein QYF61_013245 [Mycteria americana]KAK4830757.1 hypothetical protein QYF61_013246 [Mycteria americana]